MTQTAHIISFIEPQSCTAVRDEDASQDWLNLLHPLLAALNWKGNERHLREALPGHGGLPGLKEFREIMAHLGFASQMHYGNPHTLAC